ncbi:MAG: hypothetical protein GPJ21_09355 [Microcystis aeruginosa W13-11]|nr:hypothetical protein [Microcystis aeruginosa W13-11]
MPLKQKYITDEQRNQIGILSDIEEYRKLLEDSEELNAIRAYDLAISEEEEIPFEEAIAEIENSHQ